MNVFDLAAKITLDTSGYERGMNTARGQASAFAGELKGVIGNVLSLGTVAAGVVKTVEAVVGGVKQSVSEFADTQQLVGGVETLYKDSADIIKAYADSAYQTAGMSANDYMETATSFAARLIDGLGGDTEAAAQLVDTANTDMADNANKFGTDIGLIQNAYQGFAKQNYSMLDNLKLGFGGTQAEMYRLLQTAQELEPTFDAVFSMDAKGHLEAELADIIEAIHIIQTDMGVVGTTADEAAGTISGSFASAKAALDNFTSGMANPEADVSLLFDQMVESAKVAKDNVVPAVQEVFANVGELAGGFAAAAAEAEALAGIDFSPASDFFANLSEEAPAVLESTASAVQNMASAIGSIEIEKYKATSEYTSDLLMAFTDVAAARVTQVTDGLAELSGVASENSGPFGELAGDVADLLEPFTDVAVNALDSAADALIDMVFAISADAAENSVRFADGLNRVFDAAEPLIEFLAENARVVNDFIDAISDTEMTAREKGEAIGKIFADAGALVKSAWEDVKSFFSGLPDELLGAFSGIGAKFKSIGTNIVDGIKSGITEKWNGLKDFVTGLWSGLVGASEKANEIHSPSRVYERIGKFLVAGAEQGWDREFGKFRDQISGDWDSVSMIPTSTVDFAHSAVGKSSAASINASMLGQSQSGQPLNVNLVVDGRTLAAVMLDPLKMTLAQKGESLA